jgi:hypothetical protein
VVTAIAVCAQSDSPIFGFLFMLGVALTYVGLVLFLVLLLTPRTIIAQRLLLAIGVSLIVLDEMGAFYSEPDEALKLVPFLLAAFAFVTWRTFSEQRRILNGESMVSVRLWTFNLVCAYLLAICTVSTTAAVQYTPHSCSWGSIDGVTPTWQFALFTVAAVAYIAAVHRTRRIAKHQTLTTEAAIENHSD